MKKLFAAILLVGFTITAHSQTVSQLKSELTAKMKADSIANAKRLFQVEASVKSQSDKYNSLPALDTTGKQLKISGGKVVVLADPDVAAAKSQVGSQANLISNLQEQSTSYQKQINAMALIIEDYKKRIESLESSIAKLKTALQ